MLYSWRTPQKMCKSQIIKKKSTACDPAYPKDLNISKFTVCQRNKEQKVHISELINSPSFYSMHELHSFYQWENWHCIDSTRELYAATEVHSDGVI